MAYIKTVWTNGTTKLNADNMNHIENGIADCDHRIDNCSQKGYTLVANGTFNSSGEFTVPIENLYVEDIHGNLRFQEALYWFTYGNTQAFIYITQAMFGGSVQSPIRAPIAVIYDDQGRADVGFIRIEICNDYSSVRFKVANSSRHVYQGFNGYFYRTNIM